MEILTNPLGQADSGLPSAEVPAPEAVRGILDQLALPKVAKKKRTRRAAGPSRKKRRSARDPEDASVDDSRELNPEARLVEDDAALVREGVPAAGGESVPVQHVSISSDHSETNREGDSARPPRRSRRMKRVVSSTDDSISGESRQFRRADEDDASESADAGEGDRSSPGDVRAEEASPLGMFSPLGFSADI